MVPRCEDVGSEAATVKPAPDAFDIAHVKRCSAFSHARSHNVTSETARTDLTALERRGLLVQRKFGRRFVWFPAPNLTDLLPAASQSESSPVR
jgi:hypothetical protein